MKILALEKALKQATPGEYQPHLRAEAAEVYELYLSGTIREHYFHGTDHTAVLILECSSVEEAQEVLGSLPLVQAGLITFEVIPLLPYSGLSRLVNNSG
jgi:hypothetical protein